MARTLKPPAPDPKTEWIEHARQAHHAYRQAEAAYVEACDRRAAAFYDAIMNANMKRSQLARALGINYNAMTDVIRRWQRRTVDGTKWLDRKGA